MTFFDRLIAATAGFSGYARLGRNQASGFGFMAFILLIAMTISCVVTTIQASNGLGQAAAELASVPDFALENGEVKYNGPQPLIVDEGGSLVIIDTTGKTGPEALKGRSNAILITKNRIYQIQPGRGVQETDLSQIPFSITKNSVIGMMGKLWIFVPIGYAFMFLFQLGFKALDACILGLVGLIYGSATGKKVEFGLAFKLGLYAMTIPMLLQWVIPGFSTIPFGSLKGLGGFLGWWAIAIIYLIFGLKAYFDTPDDNTIPTYPGYPQQ